VFFRRLGGPEMAPPRPFQADPLTPQSRLQTFQGDPLALTPTPGAGLSTTPGHTPRLTPNLPKRFGVSRSFGTVARSLLKSGHLSRLPASSLSRRALRDLLKRHRWNDASLASTFLSLPLPFRLILLALTGAEDPSGLMGAAVGPFSILALSTVNG
jgi:hypothetical protein